MSFLQGSGDRADPRALLAEAKSVVVVALQYASAADEPVPLRTREGSTLTGSVARYARGLDYHQVLRDRLIALAERAAALVGRPVLSRASCRHRPLLERESAALAGLGFLGKNTLAIVAGLGSYVLLGELCSTSRSRRGSRVSRAAARAARASTPARQARSSTPTYSTRAAASLTSRSNTPGSSRVSSGLIGTRVFGCDVCQEVCPYNASSPARDSAGVQTAAGGRSVDLVALLELGSATYRKFVKRSSLRRANRSTLSRNAAIALGNTGDVRAEAPLANAVTGHPIALVRGHAAWALGELGEKTGPAGRAALEQARVADDDPGSARKRRSRSSD